MLDYFSINFAFDDTIISSADIPHKNNLNVAACTQENTECYCIYQLL